MDIQYIATNILWDEVSDYIEKVSEFKKMIAGISYIDHEVADEVVWCEVFDTEEFRVLDHEVSGNELSIEFEMPFLLSAWKSDQQLFRVTAYVTGMAVMENGKKTEIGNVTYDGVEVDSVYL